MADKKNNISNYFFVAIVVGITLLFFGLIKDYLLGVFWAVVLALLFQGVYQYLLERTKGRRNLSSFLSLLVVTMLVIIPLTLLITAVVNEGQAIASRIQNGDLDVAAKIQDLREQLPATFRSWGLPVDSIAESLSSKLSDLSETLAGKVLGFTQGVVGFFVQLAVSAYLLFFFFRDGQQIIQSFMAAFPMDDRMELQLFRRFESVAKATMRGSLLIAILQGLLGGILFFSLGVEGAVILGAVMVLSALLPVGTVLVWGPVAAVLFMQGAYTKGIIVVVIGSLLIGVIDNVLRPRLVANDTKMPDYLILISTLGGLTWFGLSGFVIGPIIAALFVTCWMMMGEIFPSKKVTDNP